MGEISGIRRCANKCFFCFINGLPEGLRKSLYVKDDDVLHSYLFGNFVTLTNFREADWTRLQAQRLSPLFVSVHTTDLDLRRKMLGNPKAPDILEQLRRLGSLRLQVHAQIVLCPGVNDGDNLVRTVEDLAALYPTVQSIGVVPVGITRYVTQTHGNSVSRPSAKDAAAVLSVLAPLQRRFRRELGLALVYAADEFYLMAGAPIPSGARYDGYPQLGNGIGMTRKLLEEWRYLKRRQLQPMLRRVVVLTGMLIASTFRTIIDDLRQFGLSGFELLPVANGFFGPTVTVSGLLTGTDAIATLRQSGRAELAILPRTMLDLDGERFLDGLTPQDVERETGAKVVAARTIREMLAAAASLA